MRAHRVHQPLRIAARGCCEDTRGGDLILHTSPLNGKLIAEHIVIGLEKIAPAACPPACSHDDSDCLPTPIPTSASVA